MLDSLSKSVQQSMGLELHPLFDFTYCGVFQTGPMEIS